MAVKFERRMLSSERFESAGVFDVNGDGVPDIVSGAYWYEGPDFKKKHQVYTVPTDGNYHDDFSTIALDVNGDGRLDFVTGGWFGETLRWHENPGEAGGEWAAHVIAKPGNIETTRAWDVDRDGVIEIVPNAPGAPLTVYKLKTDGQGRGLGEFTSRVIRPEPQGHGLGFGDISGSGRGDFVLANGWLEAPEDALAGEWTWHPDFELGMASVPILVADVNGDGLNDLIVGQAHGYGLDWWEQRMQGAGRSWIKHPIDPFCSQYHDMMWGDIDGDGRNELVTGKRYYAHCGRDPGADDDIGICYFKWNGESFSKQVIAFGPLGQGAGCGIHFAVADLYGTGRLDIVAPGKDGLHLFRNMG